MRWDDRVGTELPAIRHRIVFLDVRVAGSSGGGRAEQFWVPEHDARGAASALAESLDGPAFRAPDCAPGVIDVGDQFFHEIKKLLLDPQGATFKRFQAENQWISE